MPLTGNVITAVTGGRPRAGRDSGLVELHIARNDSESLQMTIGPSMQTITLTAPLHCSQISSLRMRLHPKQTVKHFYLDGPERVGSCQCSAANYAPQPVKTTGS